MKNSKRILVVRKGMGLVWIGLAMLVAGIIILALGKDERVGVVLYMGSSFPFALRTLLWRTKWFPGS